MTGRLELLGAQHGLDPSDNPRDLRHSRDQRLHGERILATGRSATEADDGGLTALILGSAAGGGFPQWNCACRLCALARSGDSRLTPRAQAGVAFSADRRHWLLVGASPDLRQQILAHAVLQPAAPRQSPIFGVVLVSADVDGIVGLIALRERHRFTLFAPPPILAALDANPIFGVLDPDLVTRVPVAVGQTVACGNGLRLTMLALPGKTPLYRERRGARQPEAADTYAALIAGGGRSAIFAPACAEVTDSVRQSLAAADLLLFDATVFSDDELPAAGVGDKTGRRMGHVPVSGPDGSLARLGGLANRRVYIHINNTNPLLLEGSPERRQAEAGGFAIAYDGMEIRL